MTYRERLVWQKAISLVEAVYALTRRFPPEERFVFANQMQRSAISVPSAIAQGHGRKATGTFLRHRSIASGSLTELETQLQIAHRVGYVGHEALSELLAMTEEVGKMLSGLQNSLDPGREHLDPES
ncbi:MAG: four helix bundle protein [Burkholderiales bacterium]|nr:four helix bundle protein [Burkholderiales bacterium]